LAHRRRIELVTKAEALIRKMYGKIPYWVRCDGKGKPIGSRRYMWGSIFRRYSHGVDLSIIEVDDHPLITITTISDIIVESWEYIDYPLSDKAFKIYLKTSLKNKRHDLKVWIESRKEKATPLWVTKGCEQNPSCLGHDEDEI
jgi:hypothetical protein